MTNELEELLDNLKNSGSSAALSIADHMETVASNGPEYATNTAMLYEAEALRDYAADLAAALTKLKGPEDEE